jgi:hypothetical protein
MLRLSLKEVSLVVLRNLKKKQNQLPLLHMEVKVTRRSLLRKSVLWNLSQTEPTRPSMTRRIASGDLIKKVSRCLLRELRLMKEHPSSNNPLKILVDLVMIEMFTILYVKTPMCNPLLGQGEKPLSIPMVLILNLMFNNLEKTLVKQG